MAHNKQRGKYFEDKVSNIIREILGLKKTDIHRFYESGMATGEFGDIKTPYPWIIECKYYKDISLDTLVFSQSKRLEEWLQSAIKDANKYEIAFNVKPLVSIVTSRPNSKILIITPNIENDFINVEYTYRFVNPLVRFYYKDYELYVTELKEFVGMLKSYLQSKGK